MQPVFGKIFIADKRGHFYGKELFLIGNRTLLNTMGPQNYTLTYDLN